jgi:hypothetical protein
LYVRYFVFSFRPVPAADLPPRRARCPGRHVGQIGGFRAGWACLGMAVGPLLGGEVGSRPNSPTPAAG